MIKVEKNIAGRPLKIESGQIARQAGGSVMISYGETLILATPGITESLSIKNLSA